MTATIELTSARRKLCAALGEKQKEYFSHMKSWFRKRISKEEFDIEARKLIPTENSHLHNEFFLAILNKCQTLALASFQPSISLASKTNSSETSYLQSSQGRLIKGEIPSKMTCVDPSSILIPRKYEGDERLKIGSYNKQKNKNMNFDYRFQAQPVYSFVQDIDEIHANVETLPEQNMIAQREPTIPDSALIHGRLLMAAWEEGMEGPGTAEEEVVRIIEIAVEQALRNLVTALLMDRNGYRLKSGAPFAVGNPAPDPWVWNNRKNETKKKIGTTESLNPEHPVPVPKARPTQKDAEHSAMMETACSARDDTQRESYLPREPITLFDLFNTMQKHKNLIPSHTVYALNMERIVSRLHHEGRDDYLVLIEMGVAPKDAIIPENSLSELIVDKHIDFIANYETNKNTKYEYSMSESLRMSGIYWACTALDIMNASDRMEKNRVIQFLQDCFHSDCGGFGPFPQHDPNLLSTLSAVQIAAMYNIIDDEKVLNIPSIVSYVKSLQQEDGSFAMDKWGEIDTRFSFCAVATLALLGHLDTINVEKAVSYVCQCMNFDGGFGTKPGSESHAGQIYCCVAFLSITGDLHRIDADLLGWWLAERQLPSGGLNGRPEKLPDVCYSWWVLSAMEILGRLHWIDAISLRNFILASQDDETGGISDRPSDYPDPFHTLFGVAGISLLSKETKRDSELKKVNPVFCMPDYVIHERKIKIQKLSL